jgi:ribosomal protein S18 acetylase RimI-like enzyme
VDRHLAQLNVATLRHPLDDPRIADFVDALPAVNGAGEQSPGYVWRLQSDSGDATDIRVFDDPLVIVNLTLWESLEALKAFAYRGIHRDFFRRRAEWFVEGSTRTALWWVRAGVLPTTDEAKRRLDFIAAFGASPYAFEMGQNHAALVVERVGPDDHRAREFTRQLQVDLPAGEAAGLVVAQLDDVTVACGAYRQFDDTTAAITRIHVAEQARGMRVGAAIIAELEAAARANRAQSLLLETRVQMQRLYEKFGFHLKLDQGPFTNSTELIRMEKALTA